MSSRSSDGGYVTLAVLIVTAVLGVVVTSLLMVSRPALGLARIGFDEVASSALVDGGLNAAGYLLFSAKRDVADVDQLALELSTGRIEFDVIDEGGRIDLNHADPQLLAGLYTAVGGKTINPAAFAALVTDWRDEDSDVSLGGAEENNYTDAGYGGLPANRPFRSIDELRLLLGLTDKDFALLAPYVTVYNPGGHVDPLTAPEKVLNAVPGLSKPDVDRLLTRRVKERDRGALLATLSVSNDFLQSETSGVYSVTIRTALNDGYTDAVQAVLIAPAQGTVEYGVVDWSRLPAAQEAD